MGLQVSGYINGCSCPNSDDSCSLDCSTNGESIRITCIDLHITRNLRKMSSAAGLRWIYDGDLIGKAGDSVVRLEEGITELKSNPAKYKQYEHKSWGRYAHFIEWLENLLTYLKNFKHADIYTCM